MGCWGEKIFQSDAALDLIDGIISDAGLELYRFDNDTAVTTARDALDAGLLAMLVAKYGAEPSDIWDDPSHKIFLLVALAMQTGAAVDEELRASVKDLMPEIATPDEAKKQMRVALRVYKSGKRYIFDSPGLVATTRANMNEHVSTVVKEDEAPANAVCKYCRSKGEELKAGKRLMRCSQCRCDEIWYCSRVCQKNDWKDHKTTCTLGMKNDG